MCVICSAAKKRHMKREEVLEAVKNNGAGFFGYTLRDGVRATVRTLDKDEFMAFFDSVGVDDPWVMHARIPSRGEKTLDNVHGWEEDGIIFCHNMTIYALDDMMKRAGWNGTDSEFFFRQIFMPFYRGCGEDAYKDGKFCAVLDNFVRHFVGTNNKFLFIMPDDRQVCYGNWVTEDDRVEDGVKMFKASNSTYKVFRQVYPSYQQPRAQPWYCGATWPAAGARDDPEDVEDMPGRDDDEPPWTGDAELTAGVIGRDVLARMILKDIVANGILTVRKRRGASMRAVVVLEENIPEQLTSDSAVTAVRGLEKVAKASGADNVRKAVKELLCDYAAVVFDALADSGKHAGAPKETVEDRYRRWIARGYRDFTDEWNVFSDLAMVDIDYSAPPKTCVCAMDAPRRAATAGKWSAPRISSEEILTANTGMKPADFMEAVRLVLMLASPNCE